MPPYLSADAAPAIYLLAFNISRTRETTASTSAGVVHLPWPLVAFEWINSPLKVTSKRPVVPRSDAAWTSMSPGKASSSAMARLSA